MSSDLKNKLFPKYVKAVVGFTCIICAGYKKDTVGPISTTYLFSIARTWLIAVIGLAMLPIGIRTPALPPVLQSSISITMILTESETLFPCVRRIINIIN